MAAGVCSVRDMTTGEQRAVSVVEGPGELIKALGA